MRGSPGGSGSCKVGLPGRSPALRAIHPQNTDRPWGHEPRRTGAYLLWLSAVLTRREVMSTIWIMRS